MTLGIEYDNGKFRKVFEDTSKKDKKLVIKEFKKYVKILSNPTKQQLARKKNAN